MTAQVIQRQKLGALTKIGQGGQGIVYAAPNVKTKFAASMVYKEYKPQSRAGIDFTALAAMPALVEDSLSYAQGERLISIAAWPCAMVEDAGAPTGFVMPAIPDRFFIPLTTAKGVSSSTAEFQHLLNPPSVLAARGIDLSDAQRCSLLRAVATGLAFLHRHGVCVGDISPKNLLFSLTPHEAVFFIDCDAMRINAVSALPQVETPGWNVPAGQELATIYSDTYKLGLLALRLLVGDQDTRNPDHLPPATPALLRQVITDTLNNDPQRRPLPEAWTYVLGNAVEEAQHREKTGATAAAPVGIAPAPPPRPVVRSRPTTPIPPSRPPIPRMNYEPPLSRPPERSWTPQEVAPASSTNRGLVLALATALAVLVVVAIALTVAVVTRRDNPAPSPQTSSPPLASAPPSTPPSTVSQPATTTTAEAPTTTTTGVAGIGPFVGSWHAHRESLAIDASGHGVHTSNYGRSEFTLTSVSGDTATGTVVTSSVPGTGPGDPVTATLVGGGKGLQLSIGKEHDFPYCNDNYPSNYYCGA